MFTLCDLHLPNTTFTAHFTQMIVRSFFTPQETLLTSMYYNMAEYMYVYVYICIYMQVCIANDPILLWNYWL